MLDASKAPILFVLNDPALIELDSILPVVAEFTARGHRTTILSLQGHDGGLQRFYLELARRVASEVIVGVEAVLAAARPSPGLVAALIRRPSVRRFIERAQNTLIDHGGPARIMSHLILEAARSIVSGSRLAFVCHQKGQLEKSGLFWEMMAVLRGENVKVVTYPAAASAFHDRIGHIEPFDLVLVANRQQEDYLKDTVKLPAAAVAAVGFPKFDANWRRKVFDAYAAYNPRAHATDLGGDAVLLLMKDENSVVWSGIDHDETIGALLASVIAGGRRLIVKLHPRQSYHKLNHLFDVLPPNSFVIDDGPVTYWARRSTSCIGVFTGATIDAIAEGVVPILYWPVDRAKLANHGLAPSIAHYFSFMEDGTMKTQFDDYAHVVTDLAELAGSFDDQSKLANFSKTFENDGAAAKIYHLTTSLIAPPAIPDHATGAFPVVANGVR